MNRKDFLAKINYSSKRYQKDIFELYYKWCEAYSYNDKTHQILLNNAQMFNWWNAQFKILEGFAFSIATENPNLPKEELKAVYHRQVVKIKNYYPKAKIKEVLKGIQITANSQYRTHLQNLN